MRKLLLLIFCFPLFSFGQDTVTLINNSDENSNIMVVEKMPEFPGGDLGLMNYISNNINYPKEAKNLNITGKVYVQFTVDTTGEVTNVKIARGVDQFLDDEAIRVVQSFPKFSPATQRGKPIAVPFTIPINFIID